MKPCSIWLAVLGRHADNRDELPNIAWRILRRFEEFHDGPDASVPNAIRAQSVHPVDDRVIHRIVKTLQTGIEQNLLRAVVDANSSLEPLKSGFRHSAFLDDQRCDMPTQLGFRSFPKLARVGAIQSNRPIRVVADRWSPNVRTPQTTKVAACPYPLSDRFVFRQIRQEADKYGPDKV